MRASPRPKERWIAALGAGAAARVDWRAWCRMPVRLARHVAPIERRTGSILVVYPRWSGPRPAAWMPPCRLLGHALMNAATIARLGALERAYGGRWILVAYRAPSASRRR